MSVRPQRGVLAALAPAGVSVSHPKAKTSTSTHIGSTPLTTKNAPWSPANTDVLLTGDGLATTRRR